MPVFAVWSAPRARSTVFFRSMLERGDVIALHEPFGNLVSLYTHTVESSEQLARFAAHHRRYYQELHAERLDVADWEFQPGS